MPDAVAATAAIDWSPLRKSLRGDVVFSGDDRLLQASKQYGAGAAVVLPQALICCADESDAQHALSFLRRCALPFAWRSGGHCFGDLSSSPVAVIDLAALNEIHCDGDRVAVGPGAYAVDLSRALSAQRRVIPTGGCPWVAAGGLSLVGGFGFLGRKFGLLADQVCSLRMLTASGELLDIDGDRHPDLFWALRGAGAAGFGLVTELTLCTQALPELLVCHGQWPLPRAVDLILRWQDHAPMAHRDINLEIGLIGPDVDDEDCYVELFGIVLGRSVERDPHLQTLKSWLGGFADDLNFWPLQGSAAADYLVGMLDHRAEEAWQPSRPYATPGYQFTHSHFFDRPLPADAIAECVARFGADRQYNQHRELEWVPWRGAYQREDIPSCFAHREAHMLVRHTTVTGHRAEPSLRAHARQWVGASRDALSRYDNGGVYQGYADPGLANWQSAYYKTHYSRLQSIKRQYDPDNIFQHAQSIAP